MRSTLSLMCKAGRVGSHDHTFQRRTRLRHLVLDLGKQQRNTLRLTNRDPTPAPPRGGRERAPRGDVEEPNRVQLPARTGLRVAVPVGTLGGLPSGPCTPRGTWSWTAWDAARDAAKNVHRGDPSCASRIASGGRAVRRRLSRKAWDGH